MVELNKSESTSESISLFHKKIEGAPQFVSYFRPVHRALLHFDGQATGRQVYDFIAEHEGLTDEDKAQVNQNGRPTFENRAAWARFYMTKAGWMYSPKRGVWALTEKGNQTKELTDSQAAALFKSVATKFRGHEEDVAAPEEEVQPDDTQFWFVGTMWWGDDEPDQMPRFIEQGIWQNGHDKERFRQQVHLMKAGDRIAIKASFVRKHDVPFDNHGLSVSAMRIKALGTITRNHGDRRTVDVEWEQLHDPKEWYFYTYRSTITRARVEDDELARRLVAFTFNNVQQDYVYFMTQPYWREKFATPQHVDRDTIRVMPEDELEVPDEAEETVPAVEYGIQNIVDEGCFVPETELAGMLKRWSDKKNLILQGPPGTGKTWLAKRLAKALIGQKNIPDEQLRIVQFHPSLSYEDFVRGYRPGSDGRLTLTDGLFLQVVEAARAQPDLDHVLIIEEINRGNPAQVLGEMLTLLESTKREGSEAMELAYARFLGERVYVPENLFVIGTMNVADRSLALVDLALRRRFAFVNLVPSLNDSWQRWCEAKGIDTESCKRIRAQVTALNHEIATDRALGPQFQIGHSYVTPSDTVTDVGGWFNDVVQSEIGPLLHEYWFDSPERADDAIRRLLAQA